MKGDEGGWASYCLRTAGDRGGGVMTGDHTCCGEVFVSMCGRVSGVEELKSN